MSDIKIRKGEKCFLLHFINNEIVSDANTLCITRDKGGIREVAIFDEAYIFDALDKFFDEHYHERD